MNNQQLKPLRADGAEFYTLANILLRRITAFRAYQNQESWDIICLSNDRKQHGRFNAGTADFNAYVIPKSDFPKVLTKTNALTSAVKTLTQYKDNWQVFDSINPANQKPLT